MEFEKVLTHRVSTRKYNDKMPDDSAIQKILDAALLAPIVHWHKLHLTVVTSKEAMNIADEAAAEIFAAPDAPIKMPRPYMYGAPIWIILSGKIYDPKEDPQADRKNDNLFWNVGSIIENMELQATELGLASCGINTTVVAMRNRPDVKKAVGIPEGYDALASVIVGYSDAPLPERKVKPEFIPVSYVR
ncbi:MAG: nitroreductase family protein [Synergistaceae bacterium]|nr:nitroreductase family protein [Synergistaceae bacterium]